MTFAGAPEMSNWGSRGFSYHLFFLSALESSLAKGHSFLPLFSVSVVGDILIQLVSDSWDMESSLSPLSLSINLSGGRDPGGWILKFKGRAKTNLSSTHCSHFGSHVCLNGKWQVVLITFLSLCPPGGPSISQPCWKVGTLSLYKCSAWKCRGRSPFCSLHNTLKPSWLHFFLGNPRCRSTKWETTSELGNHDSFPGQLLPQRWRKRKEGEGNESF